MTKSIIEATVVENFMEGDANMEAMLYENGINEVVESEFPEVGASLLSIDRFITNRPVLECLLMVQDVKYSLEEDVWVGSVWANDLHSKGRGFKIDMERMVKLSDDQFLNISGCLEHESICREAMKACIPAEKLPVVDTRSYGEKLADSVKRTKLATNDEQVTKLLEKAAGLAVGVSFYLAKEDWERFRFIRKFEDGRAVYGMAMKGDEFKIRVMFGSIMKVLERANLELEILEAYSNK